MRTGSKPTATDNPYSYNLPVEWPVIWFKAPYIVSGPGINEDLSVTLSLRLPLNVEKTVKAHCRALGVNKSDWLRTAVLHLLSIEQQWLDEHINK